MTGPTPTPPPKNEAEYAKKLALAILSTLEQKGLLSRLDVDTILHAAHRAATPTSTPTPPLGGPAALGTRWVKAEAPKQAAPVSPKPASQPAEQNKGVIVIGDENKGDEKKEDTEKSAPPVIDFSVD